MLQKSPLRLLITLLLVAGCFSPILVVQADKVMPSQHTDVTAYDLIAAMNQLRVSYGHSALIENSIIDAVAQATAQYMADNQMSSHIGDVKGRLSAAGYGGGATIWATENFAAGSSYSIDEIMVVWADADHMLPATNGSYCHVGAGIATSSNGLTYYVLQAAYISGKSCSSSTAGSVTTTDDDTETTTDDNGAAAAAAAGVPNYIIPVSIATPDADGKIYHEVQAGQSFWSIAIAYQITINDLLTWNNLTESSNLQIGEKLFIPGDNTEGYSTPTPVGMVLTSSPDAEGKIVHTVESYQTLSTIASAYGISVDTILALNGLSLDWPLQIGQSLLIQPAQVTPSPTEQPLSPLQMLTPGSDGQYHHTVEDGETLSYIAGLYEISVDDLMSWNGFNSSSILQVGADLVLRVTPPATNTPTPAPPTDTPTITETPGQTDTPTVTITPVFNSPTPTATSTPAPANPDAPVIWMASLGLVTACSLFVFSFISRRKQKS